MLMFMSLELVETGGLLWYHDIQIYLLFSLHNLD